MNSAIQAPVTYINHPNNWKFQALVSGLFITPVPEQITEAVDQFIKQNPLVLEDFPKLEHTYSRTILYRHPNGYEAMAARWDKGAVSSIHGHPHYALILVVSGKLFIENYDKTDQGLRLASSDVLSRGQFFSDIGDSNRFDNHIHKVTAHEETLSIHLSSDDAAKGEVYTLD